jgi:hypothetical protein
MTVLLSNIGNNNTCGLQVGGFKVLQQAIGVFFSRWHTIVTNQRLCEDQNLAAVRRISQRLGVSDQGSGENGFTRNVCVSSKGLAMEDRTISDRKGGRLKASAVDGGQRPHLRKARLH